MTVAILRLIDYPPPHRCGSDRIPGRAEFLGEPLLERCVEKLSGQHGGGELEESSASSCSGVQLELRAASTTSTRICSHHSCTCASIIVRAPATPR